MREIIFDTETTGLYPDKGDRIIEIGAIEMVDRFPTGRTYHQYIHPGEQPIHPDAQKVHGISLEKLKDEPSFEEIKDGFLEFFSEGKLIAHNAKFDMGFINAELRRIDYPAFANDRVIDTLVIARRKFPGARNSLDALCDRFGISNAHRTLHGALLDSELLADVYIELTGGRQAGLVLEQDVQTASEQNLDKDSQVEPRVSKSRPSPLPSRLTAKDEMAHKEFVETIGDGAIWRKWQ